MDNDLFKNKYRIPSARLPGWDYSSAGFYFVTICTKDRVCRLGEVINGSMLLSEQGNMVKKFWFDLPNNYKNCKLDEFIIMPDHFHGIVVIENNDQLSQDSVETIHELSLQKCAQSTDVSGGRDEVIKRRKMLLPKIIGRFKMQSAKDINILQNTPGKPFWQSRYYDRIIWDDKSLNNIQEYIKNNPFNWEADRNNPEGLYM